MTRLADEMIAGLSPVAVGGSRADEGSDLGVATVRPHTTRVSQIVTLVAVVVPPVGILSAAGTARNTS